VAIVQISRITARKGLQEDLPQPLAGAELGWAVDDRRLFIGNGTIEEGAPVVGNTEILTEFSDILGFATEYTYKGQAAGYTVQTGATPGSPVSQSLQSRLDSYAIITDFGAVGDGVTDDTAAINRALFQLYCVQTNTTVRRSLFFPAGTYRVSDTLLVPSYAKLYGEGANSSIISFSVQLWAANTSYAAGVLVEYLPTSTYYRSQSVVPATGIAISNTAYWVAESLPAYVIRTADSLQQSGVNIGTNGATPPQNIEMSSMAVVTDQVHNGVFVQTARDCSFNNISIIGALTTGDLNTAADDVAAIRWDSIIGLVTRQVYWTNCVFSGFTYGTITDDQVRGITISNSSFDTLYQGVYLGGTTVVNGGPTGFRLMHNKFDNIYAEGVVVNNAGLNATGYNVFYDVGNQLQGVNSPASPIISIDADNNVSIGDMFQRSTAQSSTFPRIYLYNAVTSTVPVSIGIDSAAQTQLGSYIIETATQATLTAGVSNAPLFTKNSIKFPAFSMEYTIVRETSVRTGTLIVVNDADDSAGDGLSYTDDYVENSDPDVILDVTDVGSTISVLYTSSVGRGAGRIYYTVTHFSAQ
jgi:hypothetical protein